MLTSVKGILTAALVSAGCFAWAPSQACAVPVGTSLLVGDGSLSNSNYLTDSRFAAIFDIATTSIIDFEGPWSPPNPTTASFFNQGLVGDTYLSQGVRFGNNDRFMGGQPGFGWYSPPTVVGDGAYPYNGTIDIYFTEPGTTIAASLESVALHTADGPSSEVYVKFFDITGSLLQTIFTPVHVGAGGFGGFVGFSSLLGIHHVQISNYGADDYYIDNLTFGSRPGGGGGGGGQPVPEPASTLLLATGLLGGFGLKRRRSSLT